MRTKANSSSVRGNSPRRCWRHPVWPRFLLPCSAAALIATFLLQTGSSQTQLHEIEHLVADYSRHRQPPGDTEFVFARVQFTSNGPGRRNFGPQLTCIPDTAQPNYMYGFGRGRVCGWAHDYPDGEQHLNQLLKEATVINTNNQSYVIVKLDSDEIFRYPWAYFSEIGEMTLNAKEASNLREYLKRGGFIVADDFDGDSLEWFEAQMKAVAPNGRFEKLTVDHPIFHTFYDIPTLQVQPPYEQRGDPDFWGYFDEHGRLCMLLNHNNDLGDFWEWIDQPEYPLEPSTVGIRLGINYVMYSLTH